MATRPNIRPITADDLAGQIDDKLVEIVAGEWVERPVAGELHGAIGVKLIVTLDSHVRPNRLGRVYGADTTFVLEGTPDNIITMRLPDVAFVVAARLKEADRNGYYFQAPDLAIEIVSPSERSIETQRKINDYLRTGTREVWVVYPETRQVVVHRADGTATIYGSGQEISGGELLPGFSMAVEDVFDV